MFWACENDTGIFEQLNEEDLAKYKRMSKYKKEEMAAQKKFRDDDSQDFQERTESVKDIECQTIN
jgi:hypothetical protein